MYLDRTIQPAFTEKLFKGKVMVLYGARQVGKTTFVKRIMEKFSSKKPLYFTADDEDVRKMFESAGNSADLKNIIGDQSLVVLDEAQRIENIGLKLKILADSYPKQQIIATGSSSFELANTISEPLTGRSYEFWLYPLSAEEMHIHTQLDFSRNLESLLLYGSYPGVVTAPDSKEKQLRISSIAKNYLYKDVLSLTDLHAEEALGKILTALALQLGSEVSYSELSSLVGIAKETVAKYVDLLEKAFIIFRLPPFSRNLRKEIAKFRKIYFFDLGIRNALINNFNPLHLRTDAGALWENFVVAEKRKTFSSLSQIPNLYFWRTYDQKEVDLIEEKGGTLDAYEAKWSAKRMQKTPVELIETYPGTKYTVVQPINFLDVAHQWSK